MDGWQPERYGGLDYVKHVWPDRYPVAWLDKIDPNDPIHRRLEAKKDKAQRWWEIWTQEFEVKDMAFGRNGHVAEMTLPWSRSSTPYRYVVVAFTNGEMFHSPAACDNCLVLEWYRMQHYRDVPSVPCLISPKSLRCLLCSTLNIKCTLTLEQIQAADTTALLEDEDTIRAPSTIEEDEQDFDEVDTPIAVDRSDREWTSEASERRKTTTSRSKKEARTADKKQWDNKRKHVNEKKKVLVIELPRSEPRSSPNEVPRVEPQLSPPPSVQQQEPQVEQQALPIQQQQKQSRIRVEEVAEKLSLQQPQSSMFQDVLTIKDSDGEEERRVSTAGPSQNSRLAGTVALNDPSDSDLEEEAARIFLKRRRQKRQEAERSISHQTRRDPNHPDRQKQHGRENEATGKRKARPGPRQRRRARQSGGS